MTSGKSLIHLRSKSPLLSPVIQRLTLFPLSIPLRGRVAHAAATRETADPIVIVVETPNGILGLGESLPRPYVTGETVESACLSVQSVLAPWLVEFHPQSFPEALELIESLPWIDSQDRPIPAARAAVELALLDASMRVFDRDVDAIVRWMGLPGFGLPGSLSRIRFSGVLAAQDWPATLRKLRLMYWAGLRHFKLKVGFEGDVEWVERIARFLSRPIARGQATFRVDANGAWLVDRAADWLAATSHLPIAAVEQPLPRGAENDLVRLREKFDVPIVHDESLINIADARRLKDLGVADILNIRISKCGGWIPSLRLAAYARREGIGIQLGCMVGETGVLSAAGLRFLQVCPDVRWAEGCFGTYLLSDDITTPRLRFRFGGRPPRLTGQGWGVTVNEGELRELCNDEPIVLNL